MPAPRRPGITRRTLLLLPLGWALAPMPSDSAEAESRQAAFTVRVVLLYGTFTFESAGTIDESVNRADGQYEIHVDGQGSGITHRVESAGTLRDGRWAPRWTRSRFVVYGRESRTAVSYDYGRRSIEYHSRSETFFLRRLRVADDVLPMPDAIHVDDVISAMLNYGDARWRPEGDGSLVTHVVRRRRGAREGPDDVEAAYRAELVPFVLRVTVDPQTSKPTALFDLTRFSSWARESEPARVIFSPDRRPEVITSSLILGTSVTINIGRISGGTSG